MAEIQSPGCAEPTCRPPSTEGTGVPSGSVELPSSCAASTPSTYSLRHPAEVHAHILIDMLLALIA